MTNWREYKEVTEMVGLKHLLFKKSLRELSLFSLEHSWPWRDLPADPSAMGKSLRRHGQALLHRWDTRNKNWNKRGSSECKEKFSTIRTERQWHKLREVAPFPSILRWFQDPAEWRPKHLGLTQLGEDLSIWPDLLGSDLSWAEDWTGLSKALSLSQ